MLCVELTGGKSIFFYLGPEQLHTLGTSCWISDPLDISKNVSRPCFLFRQVQQLFSQSLHLLQYSCPQLHCLQGSCSSYPHLSSFSNGERGLSSPKSLSTPSSPSVMVMSETNTSSSSVSSSPSTPILTPAVMITPVSSSAVLVAPSDVPRSVLIDDLYSQEEVLIPEIDLLRLLIRY